ncbi:GNAT family N-acetyltransferase [Plantactinospora sp. KBS50]|nr:GNAT family N-acetyltransferase [Plantactinospora sp. KBS50]
MDAAGTLLARRHARHLDRSPLLPAHFTEPAAATAAVHRACAGQDASGSIATRGGEAVGYLLGAPKSTEVWGPNIWVESAGQATIEAETIRDLYAVAATRWVDEGRTAHYALAPATDPELIGAWFRLGFGHQHTHAIRPVPASRTDPPATSTATATATATATTVRRATRDDIETLARLDLELPRHQALAPVFSAGPVPTLEECLDDWATDIDNPEYAAFVAVRDGEVIGSAIGCPLEKSSSHTGLARPERAGFLGFAAVFPQARGAGAGRALGEAVLDWTRTAGFSCAVTDWRATNLLSSRAWPALGFTDSFLRLHRVVGY